MSWQPLTASEAAAIVERVCGGKRRFGRAEARRVAARLRVRGDRVSPYRCPFCRTGAGRPAWHVGHVPSMESVTRIAEVIRLRAYPPTTPIQPPTRRTPP